MKQPTKTDFTVQVRKNAGVDVVFNPTSSHYSFHFLADHEDIMKYGPLSPGSERHTGPTGDTDRYDADAIRNMARQLAIEAIG